jgi:hypothetical protein
MNLQEQISRIQEMMGTLNESNFFERRVDLDVYKKTLKSGVPYIYYESYSLDEFKYKLLLTTLSNYIYYGHNTNIWEELDEEMIDSFVNKLDELFGDLVTNYYYDFKKNGRLTQEYNPGTDLQESVKENNKVRNYLLRRIDPDTLETIIDTNYKFAEEEYDETFTFNDFHFGIINIIVEDLHNYGYIDFNEAKSIYNDLRHYFSELLLEKTRELYDKLSQE